MMDCSDARDLMLEADPGVLEGRGESALAAHLRSCATCRADAEHVLAETAALAKALDRVPPRTAVEDALERSRTPRVRALPGHDPSPRSFARRGAGAVAAALVVGVALFASLSQDAPQPPTADVVHTPPPPSPPPVVEPSTDTDFAVFSTSDPDITVVWIYQEPSE